MTLRELWRQYRYELVDWRNAVQEPEVNAATPLPVQEQGIVPGGDRMHEVLHGLEALFGVGVREAVSAPYHETYGSVTGQLGTIRELQSENRILDEHNYEMRVIHDDFLHWVSERYYLRERKRK